MKIADSPLKSTVSFGGLLEKIEIMRSSLRWPRSLERPQIEKLLGQANSLREEALRLSRIERFVQAKTTIETETNFSVRQRREALMERDFQFDGVFGDSPTLIEALEIAEKAAPTDLPVLIDGESGTGKELMAKVIHANGSRADKQLITVNCGAIPDNLLESELFGHKRGAFTGASADRAGKFEAANQGTIFLDEIGELPLAGQVKLLRVLQSNEIQRVGSDQTVFVDARVVAATNKNLLEMCEQGTFREDLYYRLSIIQVTIPPLRERKDEIPLLIDFLSQEAAVRLNRKPIRLSKALEKFLASYNYPGNIRELRNILFRLTCLAGEEADMTHLPPQIRQVKVPPGQPTGSESQAVATAAAKIKDIAPADEKMPSVEAPSKIESEAVDDKVSLDFNTISLTDAKRIASDHAEKQFLESGLRVTGGNVTELARQIEMNRAHVQTLLKKHQISSKDFRGSEYSTSNQKSPVQPQTSESSPGRKS